jgi:hypothetical protein
MEDALWAQLQNTHLHEQDEKDVKRVESETDEEEEEEEFKESVSIVSSHFPLKLVSFSSLLIDQI